MLSCFQTFENDGMRKVTHSVKYRTQSDLLLYANRWRFREQRQKKAITPTSETYYSFLKELPLNNPEAVPALDYLAYLHNYDVQLNLEIQE